MAEWTHDELIALFPEGTVNTQVDDVVRPMTKAEWETWIQNQVGTTKPLSEIDRQNENSRLARANAFANEADPLFFGWQRGENTEQVWLDKVAEIRARFPYVEAV